MSFISRIITAVDDFFVPRDGLRDQAADIIKAYDSDGDGRVSLATLNASQVPPIGLTGIAARGLTEADRQGNENKFASLREVRNLLKQYDTGSPWQLDTANDGRLDGVEILRVLQDFAVPRPTASTTQAANGAGQIEPTTQTTTETAA